MKLEVWISIKDKLPSEYMGYVNIALTPKGWTENDKLPEAWVTTANTIFVRYNADKGWYTHWMEIPPLNK